IAIAAAAVIAALAAVADGALMALQRQSARPADSADFVAERDRARRTLGFTRLLSQLAVGVLVGLLIRDGGVGLAEVVLVLVGALALVLLTETAARAWGDSRAEAVNARLGPLVSVLELVLMPVTVLAAALDRGAASALPAPPID